MFKKIITSIFGSRNNRVIRQFQKTVVIINSLEEEFSKLEPSDFPKKTNELKERHSSKVRVSG